jgi:hypothetical protein
MSKALKGLTALAILILAACCASQSPTGPEATEPSTTRIGVYAPGGG